MSYKLALLFLRYDRQKYPNACVDLKDYLKAVTFASQVIVVDNGREGQGYDKIEFSDATYITGDNTHWEFSGWDKGVQYLKEAGIEYDAVLFVNDSFMNDTRGGTPDTIINDAQITRCIEMNVPIQAVVNQGKPYNFIIDGVKTEIPGRSHCFILPKSIIERLGSLVSLDVDFLNKCIHEYPTKPYFKQDSPINSELRNFIENWLGRFWHSAFKFEDNWNLFRMKSLAFMNELMLAYRLNELEKDIEFQIDNAEVVIFDVFDTAILRKFKYPFKVHSHMGCGYLDVRQKAEEKALADNPCCSLGDIYIAGNLPAGKKYQEQLLELVNCYANPEIFKYYEYARAKGKEIVFLSDMYLSHIDIKKMLAKCGYKNHTMLVSSETKVRKDTGEAYICLKSMFGDTEKLLMIGDNEHSDYKMAKKHGLKAIHYKKQEDAADFWFKVGYNAIGAIAYGYVQWLRRQFREKGIKKVYFFAREGALFHKIYEKIKDENDPPASLLMLSRKSLNIPLLATITKEEFFNNPEHRHLKWHLTFTVTAKSTKNYCEYFGVDYDTVYNKLLAQELIYADLTGLTHRLRENIQAGILEVIYPEVQKQARKELCGLKQYLHDSSDFYLKSLGLVDLGWGGSIQESFIKVVKKHSLHSPDFECFLLAPQSRLKDRQDKYSYNCYLEMDNPTFTNNIFLMECLFNAPFGMTTGYTSEGEPILDDEDCSYCEHIHRGVLEFVEDSEYMTMGDYMKLGLFNLNNLINAPDEQEARYIGELKLYSSGSDGIGEYIARPDLSFLEDQRKYARNKAMFDLNARQMLLERMER